MTFAARAMSRMFLEGWARVGVLRKRAESGIARRSWLKRVSRDLVDTRRSEAYWESVHLVVCTVGRRDLEVRWMSEGMRGLWYV